LPEFELQSPQVFFTLLGTTGLRGQLKTSQTNNELMTWVLQQSKHNSLTTNVSWNARNTEEEKAAIAMKYVSSMGKEGESKSI